MKEYYDYDEILLALEDPLGDQGYESASVYIDPTTDFGFKRIFGMEANKDLLLAFLNVLFRGRKQIEDLHYNKNEHVGVADRYLSM
ncbi:MULTISPECIES: Rpn family recombination-promoting nuclease/putative transposase [Sphingobacterium]|uniref:Rpn family recombination-promoting nuclease/putative transposase n=1 Tax=Sphingobacterium TaxID=28453 RepID=UPI001F0918B1|nr:MULTISPECIES: Rpn family recombination-promoting nuclease/putative transposase [unclassified Sphingobacterium]